MGSKPTLYMMMGFPGAGKTTVAQIIAKLSGAVHISSDKMRLALFPSPKFTPEEHQILYEELDHITRELLRAGKDVIYDANLNRLIHRQEKYDVCREVNAKPILVWIKTDLAVAKKRAIHEKRAHLVPPNETASSLFERLAGVFESPKADEPHVTIDGSRLSEEAVKKTLDL